MVDFRLTILIAFGSRNSDRWLHFFSFFLYILGIGGSPVTLWLLLRLVALPVRRTYSMIFFTKNTREPTTGGNEPAKVRVLLRRNQHKSTVKDRILFLHELRPYLGSTRRTRHFAARLVHRGWSNMHPWRLRSEIARGLFGHGHYMKLQFMGSISSSSGVPDFYPATIKHGIDTAMGSGTSNVDLIQGLYCIAYHDWSLSYSSRWGSAPPKSHGTASGL